jgi:hypothetical protein
VCKDLQSPPQSFLSQQKHSDLSRRKRLVACRVLLSMGERTDFWLSVCGLKKPRNRWDFEAFLAFFGRSASYFRL